MHISVLEPRKFDAELSAVSVKRLHLSIVFLIGDIQVSVTSNILEKLYHYKLYKYKYKSMHY